MNSVWIVYAPDWSDISVYFDELSAYKAAVKLHAEVVRVGEGDIKEQANNPREFEESLSAQPQDISNHEITNSPKGNINVRNEDAQRVNDQGFTTEQIEAQRRLKASEDRGPQEISLVRGR